MYKGLYMSELFINKKCAHCGAENQVYSESYKKELAF